RGGVATPNFFDLQKDARSFSDLAAFSAIEADSVGSTHADRLLGENVTPGYFRLLGVTPALGREFADTDDKGHPAVILSHGLWQTRSAPAHNALGRTLTRTGTQFPVVGVMPAGFHGYSEEAQFWVPVAAHDLIYPQVARFDFVHSRDIHWIKVLGRLRDDVTVDAAAAEVRIIGDRLAQAYPHENAERSFALAPAPPDLARNAKRWMVALVVAVGLVSLIASANISNLLLIRLSRRERELAVRLALGATRGSLFNLVLGETAIVVAMGTLLGIVMFASSTSII